MTEEGIIYNFERVGPISVQDYGALAEEAIENACSDAYEIGRADARLSMAEVLVAADALADAVELWRGEQRKSVQDALNAYYAARRHPGESAQAGDA